MSWWNSFATNEATVRFIVPVLASALTGLLLFWIRERKDKSNLQAKETCDAIRSLLEESEEIAKAVQRHLLGTEQQFRKSQIDIGEKFKGFDRRLTDLKCVIPSPEFNELHHKFLIWKTCLTGDGYPIQRREQCVAPGSQLLQERDGAQARFREALVDLLYGCLGGSIVCTRRKLPGSPKT